MIDLASTIMMSISIILSCGRNILSKSISGFSVGTSKFYRMQTMIFFCGALAVALLGMEKLQGISIQTLLYAILYGCLLMSAQWCYTAALRNGTTSVCATVYSLGFVFPALSGAVFFGERFNLYGYLGMILAIVAVISSGWKKRVSPTHPSTKGICFRLSSQCFHQEDLELCKSFSKIPVIPSKE